MNSIKNFFVKLYTSLGITFTAFLCILFVGGGIMSRKQGLDLNGGVRLLYKMDFSQYEKNYKDSSQLNEQKKTVIGIVSKNIDGRISKLGVSDYSARYVSMGGEDYMEVSIGGVQDVEKAKEIIGKTVRMTFKVPFEGTVTSEIKNERQLLAEQILMDLKSKGYDSITDYIQPYAWNVQVSEKQLSGTNLINTLGVGIEESLTGSYVYPKLVIADNSFDIYQFAYSSGSVYDFTVFSIDFQPAWEDAKIGGKLLNGERFQLSTVGRSPSGESAVEINFDDTGRTMFYQLSKKYIGKQIAIFIGNKMVTAPVIRQEISGGQAQITGGFSPKEASELSDELNTGAMPVSLDLAQEEKVAPLLGEKALKNSIIAAGIGILLIFIMFMIFYGIKYAIVTLLSLSIFFLVLGGFIKISGMVLSLSAIGAVILNIGMAVDANVLIFERICEELKRGSSWKNAIIIGYENSFSAIRDGNLTTGLIAFLLFSVGNNIFKGFGFMMIVNILIVLLVMVPSIPALLYILKRK